MLCKSHENVDSHEPLSCPDPAPRRADQRPGVPRWVGLCVILNSLSAKDGENPRTIAFRPPTLTPTHDDHAVLGARV